MTAVQSPQQPISRADIYTQITDQIIQAIEAGIKDNWRMPWRCSDLPFKPQVNIATGKAYRGINTMTLWMTAKANGYQESAWGTFKQWSDKGCRIAKGQRATLGVFWKPLDLPATEEADADDQDGEAEPTRRWVARAFQVFNAAQLVGYEPPPEPPLPSERQRIAHAEAFFAALKADIRHGGNRAFYRPASDHIQMPPYVAFDDPLAYYGTLAHEATHWTAHPSRLNRNLTGRFGSANYAMEELIAELGAAFLAADLGLSPDARTENAAYIDHWLKVLKSDNRAIFSAASLAQRAADYLQSLQPTPQPVTQPDAAPIALPVPAAASPQLAFNL